MFLLQRLFQEQNLVYLAFLACVRSDLVVLGTLEHCIQLRVTFNVAL